MKIIKIGKTLAEDKTYQVEDFKACKWCGTEFKYNRSDIVHPGGMSNIPYVICPGCGSRINDILK